MARAKKALNKKAEATSIEEPKGNEPVNTVEAVERELASRQQQPQVKFFEPPSASMSPTAEIIDVPAYAKDKSSTVVQPQPQQPQVEPEQSLNDTQPQPGAQGPPNMEPPPGTPPSAGEFQGNEQPSGSGGGGQEPPKMGGTPFDHIPEFDLNDITSQQQQQQGFEGEGQQPGGGGQSGIYEVDEESASDLAKWILDLIEVYMPVGLLQISAIDVENVIKNISLGKLPEMIEVQGGEHAPLVEIIQQVNKSHIEHYQLKPNERKLIEKPLIDVLQKRGIEASPEAMLIGVCLIVFGGKFMAAMKMRKDNKQFLEELIEINRNSAPKSNSRPREGREQKREPDVEVMDGEGEAQEMEVDD